MWSALRAWGRPFAFVALTASPALADTQAIAPGAQITPAQVGHIFDAVCFASTPTGMTDRVVLAESAFFFAPTDLGTDYGYQSADGMISVTLDGNPIEQTCTVALAAGVGGDGAELYDSVAAHLSEHLEGALPDAEYTDGGVIWAWDGSNASFILTYTEADGAFTLSLVAEG